MSERKFQKLNLESFEWEPCDFMDIKQFDAFRYRDNPEQSWKDLTLCWIARNNHTKNNQGEIELHADPASNGKIWEIQCDITNARRKESLKSEYEKSISNE